ncbi:2-hydroxycarboxylate transporter family protein [Angelakisella massiliensis]|uniref:2-hydroxycarboxylate transporter family protein n=1 Tax=Angelakisella massiliensis TaxID=1871018 RepID=UPI0008F915AC|nr:2-hydroxycarboxylate transporter family protein [Angelakisella massiliensis]
MSASSLEAKKSSGLELFGMPWPMFLVLTAIVLLSAFLGTLPNNMIGGFSFMIVTGTILSYIGDHLPIVKTYLGGGPIVVIFGSAALLYFGLIGEGTVEVVNNFMKNSNFLDFYIAALITGSILGMNRKLLINAAVRYLPAIIGGVICALGLAYIVGTLIGYGGEQAMFFVAIPIMGGGMGAGAVPLSQIFASETGQSAESLLSVMVPAVALGNALAIVFGGLLDRLGKKKPSLSGEGQLMVNRINDSSDADRENLKDTMAITMRNLGIGLLMSTAFFNIGTIIGKFVPAIHSYAWMILAVAAMKILGLVPEKFEICCHQWFNFMMSNLTSALLIGVGITYTDLGEVLSAFSGAYVILVFVTVVGAVIGSAVVGRLVGFYPIESSITAGLCMANMGGTGDVAVLSAAGRMNLMPFAQISSRIGGAFMLLLSSFLLRLFGLG